MLTTSQKLNLGKVPISSKHKLEWPYPWYKDRNESKCATGMSSHDTAAQAVGSRTFTQDTCSSLNLGAWSWQQATDFFQPHIRPKHTTNERRTLYSILHHCKKERGTYHLNQTTNNEFANFLALGKVVADVQPSLRRCPRHWTPITIHHEPKRKHIRKIHKPRSNEKDRRFMDLHINTN